MWAPPGLLLLMLESEQILCLDNCVDASQEDGFELHQRSVNWHGSHHAHDTDCHLDSYTTLVWFNFRPKQKEWALLCLFREWSTPSEVWHLFVKKTVRLSCVMDSFILECTFGFGSSFLHLLPNLWFLPSTPPHLSPLCSPKPCHSFQRPHKFVCLETNLYRLASSRVISSTSSHSLSSVVDAFSISSTNNYIPTQLLDHARPLDLSSGTTNEEGPDLLVRRFFFMMWIRKLQTNLVAKDGDRLLSFSQKL